MSPERIATDRDNTVLEQPAVSADPRTRITVVEEADEYAGSLPGVALDVVRAGRGFGPNVAKTHVDENVALAFAVVQFSVMVRTTICDYTIIVALVTSVPSPSRWSGIDQLLRVRSERYEPQRPSIRSSTSAMPGARSCLTA
jgi:hypothetical protein